MTRRSTKTTLAVLLVAVLIGGATLWNLRARRLPDPAAPTEAVTRGDAISPADAAPVADAPTVATRAGVADIALPPRRSTSSTFMPELQRAAAAGDRAAACRLAVALGRCSDRKRIELGASMGGGIAPESPVSSLDAPADGCRGATERDLEDRYRFQAQAFATGGAAAERWFVLQPMLADDDFRMNTPNAVDFRRRAPAYVARALQRRSLEDLAVLLQVYMPPGYFESSSPLRLRDDAMFLALADIAAQAGVSPEYVRATAARVRASAGSDVLALARQRSVQVGGPWRRATAQASATVAGARSGDAICDAIARG